MFTRAGPSDLCHDARVKRPTARNALLAALAAALLAAAGVVLADLDSLTAGAQPTVVTVPGATDPGAPTVSATVGSAATGQPLAPGFVGLSLEYPAIPRYTGARADRPLVRLIRNLSPGHPPVLRIGGNSTDETWWPQQGRPAPRGSKLALNERWLAATSALAEALDARMIMGLNLAGARPEAAVFEAQAFLRGVGSDHIEAFEIGNEPDLYGLFPWYTDNGRSAYRRPADYSLRDLIAEFSRWRATIGHGLHVAGPAYATFDWSLSRFVDDESGLKLVTFHHYPLDACLTNPSARGYPTIARLLGDRASSGFAARLAPAAAAAHARHLPFRLDELNSASCSGKWGVSNTFASALWILDTLFDLARAGVDGVNVHMFPGAAYAPFEVSHGRAVARPEYYGMLLFAQAFPTGARLLPVHVSPSGPLKVWATQGRGTRVTLINKDPRRAYEVRLRASGLAGPARVELLEAPSAWSIGGVTLGGRRIAGTGGLRGRRRVELVTPLDGTYSITVPAASAALLTL